MSVARYDVSRAEGSEDATTGVASPASGVAFRGEMKSSPPYPGEISLCECSTVGSTPLGKDSMIGPGVSVDDDMGRGLAGAAAAGVAGVEVAGVDAPGVVVAGVCDAEGLPDAAGDAGFRPGIAGGTNGGRVIRELLSTGLRGEGPPLPGPLNGGITGFAGRGP